MMLFNKLFIFILNPMKLNEKNDNDISFFGFFMQIVLINTLKKRNVKYSFVNR